MNIPRELIQQIRSSNDKFIFINETGEPTAVLMSYQNYEMLVKAKKPEIVPKNNRIDAIFGSKTSNGLTSDKLLDKINSEIAEWKERAESPTGLGEDYVLKNNKGELGITDENNGVYDDSDENDEALYI
jgi:hypothetical protein